MAFEFKLPDLGEGLSEATLVAWKVHEGDEVQREQVLAEVETDKALSELPSPVAGKIGRLHWKAGDTIPVGAVVVTYSTTVGGGPPRSAPKSTAEPRFEGTPAVRAAPASADAGPRPVLAAPATRKLAREKGIDLHQVRGTGPGGRITTEDVLAFAAAQASRKPGTEAAPDDLIPEPTRHSEHPAAFPRPMLPDFRNWGEVERTKASAIRKRIAQRMLLSLHTAASVTHMDEADVTELDAGRAQARAAAENKGVKLTLLPFVVKAVVAALQKRPIFNSSYDEDKLEIVLKKYFHIGIAVDSPTGLLVPVVRDADQKRIADISRDIAALAERARDGKLQADQMRGGSFTITNIGAIGGTAFTPIINWPEVAILGLGRVREAPALVEGRLVARKKLPLCLTFDHRVADGADAARFMNDIKQALENPVLLLLEG